MSQATRELKIYRKDAKSNHSLLTPAEREKLIAVSQNAVSNAITSSNMKPAISSRATFANKVGQWRGR
jgi:hypothetical protein